ncbi:MAG TPA: hypothetical protein PLD10_23445 [Rhodopila sp.]|nr:hypothetical protein [Rhodopila sp.]
MKIQSEDFRVKEPIVLNTCERLEVRYPEMSAERARELQSIRKQRAS